MRARFLFPAFIALVAIGYGLMAREFPSMPLQEGFGPGLFPGLIAATLGVLAAVEAVSQFLAYRRAGQTAPVSGATAETPDRGVNLAELRAVVILVACVIATVWAIPLVGLIPAAAGLVFVLSTAMGTRPLWKSLLISVVTAVLVYVVFAKAFNVVFAF